MVDLGQKGKKKFFPFFILYQTLNKKPKIVSLNLDENTFIMYNQIVNL